MSHLNKLRIENFRVFRDCAEFDFAPITIFTGANNSGKSSVIKAIQLLKENLINIEYYSDFDLDFTEAEHRLGGMSTVVNDAECNLKFSMPAFLPGTNEEYGLVFEYVKDKSNQLDNGRIHKITIFHRSDQKKIFELHRSENRIDHFYFSFDHIIEKWLLPLREIIIKEKIKEIREKRNPYYLVEYQMEDYDLWNSVTKAVSIFQSKGLLAYYKAPIEDMFLSLDKIIDNNIDNILSHSKEIPMFLAEILKDLLDKEKIKIEELFVIAKEYSENKHEKHFIDRLLELSSLTRSEWKKLCREHLEKKGNLSENLGLIDSDAKIHEFNRTLLDLSILGDKPFFKATGKPYTDSDGRLKIKFDDEAKEIMKKEAILRSMLPKVDPGLIASIVNEASLILLKYPSYYLSTIDTLQAAKSDYQRTYKVGKHNSNFESQIFEFLHYQIPDKAKLFLEKWINTFGLEKLKVSYTSNNIATVSFGDKALSDLGYGVSQLLSILMKIITQHAKTDFRRVHQDYNLLKTVFPNFKYDFLYTSTLMIEEPEASLHPKFQSLLADLFIDANKEFNIQFIIETHSEYLIRKLQYLTAAKTISTVDTSIYYFHNPNNAPVGEKQVKKIEILEDGSLSDDFGTGFFDEALNWKFELLKLKNKN